MIAIRFVVSSGRLITLIIISILKFIAGKYDSCSGGKRFPNFGKRMKKVRQEKVEEISLRLERFSRKRKVEFAVEPVAWSPPKTRRKTKEEEEKEVKEDPQYRIVSWGNLAKQLELCSHCSKGPLNLQNIVEEKRVGLGFVSKIECQECKQINDIRTDEVHKDDSKRGPKKSKLNERCVLGTIHSGNGHQQLEHLLSPMDIYCLHSKSYKAIERRVGPIIEKVAEGSCNNWLEKEKESNEGEQDIAISFDMGWQKRGKARNSRTGHGTAVGRSTGKIIDFETKNTSCRKCESAAKTGKEPESHDCRKNHDGSSKAMEAAAAAEIYERAKGRGVQFSTFIGDEDSTTISRVRQLAGM